MKRIEKNNSSLNAYPKLLKFVRMMNNKNELILILFFSIKNDKIFIDKDFLTKFTCFTIIYLNNVTKANNIGLSI